MKKCIHCGCVNRDERAFCADCGETLSDAEAVGEDYIGAMLENSSRYSDPFTFYPRYQVAFYVSLALVLADIALLCFSLIRPDCALISILLGAVCAVQARFSETLWNIKKFFLGLSINGEIEPSDGWFIGREIAIVGLFGFNIIIFLCGIFLRNNL